MIRKKYSFFLMMITSLLILGACQSKDTAPDKQVMTYYEENPVKSIDPSMSTDTSGLTIIGNIYEGLLGVDKEGKIVPGEAEELPEVSGDKKTYTFKLRDNLKWSDGTSITTKDYLYSYQRTLSLDSPYKYLFKMFKNGGEVAEGKKSFNELGIQATDNNTLKFELNEEEPNFLEMLTLPVFFPQSSNAKDKSLTNGPFILKNFDSEHSFTWTLEKNQLYWDKEKVTLTEIIGKNVEDNGVRLGDYNDRVVDLIPINRNKQLKIEEDPEFLQKDYYQTGYLLFNNRQKILEDEKVREMIYRATDRDEFVNWSLSNFSTPNLSLIPTNDKKILKLWEKDKYDLDTEKSKDLFETYEKDHGDLNQKLNIITLNQDNSKKIAESLRYSLDRNTPGLQLVIESLNPVEFEKRLKDRTYDLAVLNTIPIAPSKKWLETLQLESPTLNEEQRNSIKEALKNEDFSKSYINPGYTVVQSYLVSSKIKNIVVQEYGIKMYFKFASRIN